MTEQDREAVWRQVERLLTDPSLSRSKRYQSLLRYLVTHALEGEVDSLKERIVGIEVFGRRPDYDSTQDPIVRVNAAELRKRMLRYYEDPAHLRELRLSLPVGSYVPRFEQPGVDASAEVVDSSHVEQRDLPPLAILEETPTGRWKGPMRKHANFSVLAGLVLIVLALGVAEAYRVAHRKDAVARFWAPLSESSQPIMICTADQNENGASLIDANNPMQPVHEKNSPSIMSAETLSPVVDITGHLTATGHTFRVQTQAQTTFSDIAAGPVVVVGAFNNFWTLELTRSLPIHFGNDSSFRELWIQRADSPDMSRWKISTAIRDPNEEYALVARYFDTYTRQWVLVIAGLGQKSNVGALRFVLSSEGLAELDRRGLGDWSRKNIEIVLGTHVVNGNAAPSMMEYVHTW